MHYYSYDYPSAVTEERLAGIICEGVKDYLSELTDHLSRQQRSLAEKDETIDNLTAERDALRQQVAELKECLEAILAGKVGAVKNIYNYLPGAAHYDARNIVTINGDDYKKLIN